MGIFKFINIIWVPVRKNKLALFESPATHVFMSSVCSHNRTRAVEFNNRKQFSFNADSAKSYIVVQSCCNKELLQRLEMKFEFFQAGAIITAKQ